MAMVAYLDTLHLIFTEILVLQMKSHFADAVCSHLQRTHIKIVFFVQMYSINVVIIRAV